MSEEVSPNRLRAPKASERQKIELVKYFEKNLDALRIVNGYPSDHRAKQRIWIDLAHRLNCLEGALKTSLKWAKYWHDIIIYTKTRARNALCKKSGGERPPTEIEKRLLVVMGELQLLKDWEKSLEMSGQMAKSEPLSDEDNEFPYEIEAQEDVAPNSILINTCVDDENSSNQPEYLKSSTTPESPLRHPSCEEQFEYINSGQPCKRIKFNDNKVERVLEEVLQLKASFREVTSSLRSIAEGFQIVSSALLKIATNVDSVMNNGDTT